MANGCCQHLFNARAGTYYKDGKPISRVDYICVGKRSFEQGQFENMRILTKRGHKMQLVQVAELEQSELQTFSAVTSWHKASLADWSGLMLQMALKEKSFLRQIPTRAEDEMKDSFLHATVAWFKWVAWSTCDFGMLLMG